MTLPDRIISAYDIMHALQVVIRHLTTFFLYRLAVQYEDKTTKQENIDNNER